MYCISAPSVLSGLKHSNETVFCWDRPQASTFQEKICLLEFTRYLYMLGLMQSVWKAPTDTPAQKCTITIFLKLRSTAEMT